MFYEYTLTIPAGTPKATAIELDALVEPGILTRCEVDFPPGCHRLVHISIVEGKFQLFPRNPEEDMKADGYVIPIPTYIPLRRGHNQLKLRGWSPLTIYSHNIVVRLIVEPVEIASPWQVMTDFVAILKKLI